MVEWGNKVPPFLIGERQLAETVGFTTLFAVVYAALSSPFSEGNVWFALGITKGIRYTAVFFLTVLTVIIVSKRIMHMYASKDGDISFIGYILWNILEIVTAAALYSFFTIEGEELGIIGPLKDSPPKLFFRALEQSAIIIGVPYLLCGMYFALVDKNNTIRLLNYSTVVSDEILPPKDEKKITLFDSSGAMKLSIRSSSLYYIESDDNYIIVWYTDGQGMMKKYMLRCRLKTVENSFADSSLVRCHRKYIVNTEKIKVLRKEKDGFVLELENESIPPISVSKTYQEKILELVSSIYDEN